MIEMIGPSTLYSYRSSLQQYQYEESSSIDGHIVVYDERILIVSSIYRIYSLIAYSLQLIAIPRSSWYRPRATVKYRCGGTHVHRLHVALTFSFYIILYIYYHTSSLERQLYTVLVWRLARLAPHTPHHYHTHHNKIWNIL